MRATVLLRGAALDPFQILAIPRTATSKEIRSAFLALAKTHHPDLPSSSKAKDVDFKDIVSAHELLRDPKKRDAYLKYGFGWASTAGGGATNSARPDVGFNYENMHNPWGNPKTRRHKHAHERGRYPSSSWDFGHSETTDFYSSNSNPEAKGADRSGVYTSNASFMSILAGMSLLLYSVQFWRLAPPVPSSSSSEGLASSGINSLVAGDPKDAPIYRQSSMMRGRDKHHDDASRALGAAREGAQRYGSARRDNIRRRVRETTLDAVESGRIGTGHGFSSFDDLIESQDNPLLYKRERSAHQHPATIQALHGKARRAAADAGDTMTEESNV